MNPVAALRHVKSGDLRYDCLAFVCPGCKEKREGHTGLHLLPVSRPEGAAVPFVSWDWDGSLEAPTLSPSILTRLNDNFICHSYLKNGVFEYLSDCTHSLVNQHIPLPPLEDWMID